MNRHLAQSGVIHDQHIPLFARVLLAAACFRRVRAGRRRRRMSSFSKTASSFRGTCDKEPEYAILDKGSGQDDLNRQAATAWT